MRNYTLEELKLAYDMNPYMGKDHFIYFWHPDEKGPDVTKACLCQWYPSKFSVDGQTYNCAEQFMMAEKARIFGDKEMREKILNSDDPSQIKKYGKQVKGFVDAVWEELSYDIVVRGNVAKFTQNTKLLCFLLMTENKVLVEASPYDKIWGIGMNEDTAKPLYPHVWKGQNKLGFALMEARDIIHRRLRADY